MRHSFRIILGLALAAIMAHFAQASAPSGNITISPSSPTGSWTVELAKNVTATLKITVEAEGTVDEVDYELESGPSVTQRGETILWSGTAQAGTSTFTIFNTATEAATETLVVKCTWVEITTGGGSGSGGSGDLRRIHGEATGIAILGLTNVSWTFDPEVQLADGTSAITWSVHFSNDDGEPVEASEITIQSVELDPTSASWNISPTGSTEAVSELSGTIKSTDVSSGKLKVSYAEGDDATALTTLYFVKIVVELNTDVGAITYAYGFSFKVRVKIQGVLDGLETRMMIKSSTSMKDWDGTDMDRDQILAGYKPPFVGVDTNGNWVVDTGWDWQQSAASKGDDQVGNIPNKLVTIGDAPYYAVKRASKRRDFKVQLRKTGAANILEHEWGYSWNNNNAEWTAQHDPPSPEPSAAGAHLGAGEITDVSGITGLPWQ